MPTTNLPSDAEIATAHAAVRQLIDTLNTVLFGQEELVEMVVTGLLARGHMLLEGLPGLGKTELVKGLANALDLQHPNASSSPPTCCPATSPATRCSRKSDGQRAFVFQPGPLFATLVLADEINRASPKTQSALLEAMQERRVTVLGETHALPAAVLRPRHPEPDRTGRHLPAARGPARPLPLQTRRAPAATPPRSQKIVLHRELGQAPEVPQPHGRRRHLTGLLALARRFFLPEVVANYIARLVDATHPGGSQASARVKFGASPRAALSLAAAAKARALIHGRPNASFEDVKRARAAVLRHRILLDYQARVEGKSTNDVIAALLDEIPFQPDALPRTLKEIP